VFLVSYVVYLFPAVGSWRSGYGRYPTTGIVLRRESTISVDAKYIATIKKISSMVFFGQPKEEDLVDMIDTLPGEDIPPRSYSSEDSDVANYKKNSPHQMVVYWQPKSQIKPYVEYIHEMTNVSPSKYGPDFLYHGIYFDRNVGIAEVHAIVPRKIDECMAFVMPRFLNQITEKRLYEYAIKGRVTGCAQPKISGDRKNVYWRLENPKKGRRYVLFCVYKGELEAFAEKQRAKFISSKLRALISPRLGSAAFRAAG
jgi:hypothetical protein